MFAALLKQPKKKKRLQPLYTLGQIYMTKIPKP